MEINLHQLEIFLCIARERSFSKARKAAHQSTVGIHSNQKSGRFLGRKTVRAPRPAGLPHAGRRRRPGPCEENRGNCFHAAKRDPRYQRYSGWKTNGRVQPRSQRHARAARRCAVKKQYSETEISIKTGRSHEVEQWVLDNEVALGVIEGDPNSALLKKEPWYTDELVLVLARGSPLLKRHLPLSEILEQPFLLQAPGVRPTFIERVIKERGMTFKEPVTVGSREAVKAAIVAGYGVALIPQSIIDTEVRAGLVKTKKVPELRQVSGQYCLSKRQTAFPSRHRLFWKFSGNSNCLRIKRSEESFQTNETYASSLH